MAVNALDLKVLSLENVELLQRMVPTDQEVWFLLQFLKIYRQLIAYSFRMDIVLLISNSNTREFYNVTDKSIQGVHHRKEKR